MQRVISETKLPVKIWASDLEAEAEAQVKNVASLPFVYKHVAVMPDAHAGKGSTVGTVIATKGAILPAAVGVDLGCGMQAVKLPFKVDVFGDSLDKLRHSIERSVPVGHNENKDIADRVGKVMNDFLSLSDIGKAKVNLDKAGRQIGTLGGGNHFIEICQDENNDAWVMLHSGSRNIGKVLAEIHIDKAKSLMKQYFINLPDPDLCYLVQDTPEFKDYIRDMLWAQHYAKQNRKEMMLRVLKDISFHVYKELKPSEELTTFCVDCHHNFCKMEHHFGQNVWVTRKGAVSAEEGQFGIIPGSMGSKSYIVRGLGNKESFMSCSHGAGRRMSRTKARELLTEKDVLEQTVGVECKKDASVIDELPSAYKDIDQVMANQADLVKPIYTLKQILCVKG